MYYDALSRNTVKITLTGKDMKDYSIKSESLRSRTAESKRSLTSFLKKFQSERSLFPDQKAERLFLEAFPSDDGGCILYVSTLGSDILPPPETERRTAPLMCRTATLGDTARLCRSLTGKVRSSALYKLGGGYCLILKVQTASAALVSRIIGEYGSLSDDPIDIAFVTEHGVPVCPSSAVSKLSALWR